MAFKIFACKQCKHYCDVSAGLLSGCCSANIYIPQEIKRKKKKVTNPAV